jgi:AcrR family transcriptional regulator
MDPAKIEIRFMARRNDHTREELINLTLDQVKAFLDTHPHHELSLRKVAAMIGYVPSTLVNVFGNYNLLLLQVVAQTLDELATESAQCIPRNSKPKEALTSLALCYLNFAIQHPYRWQLIFQHTMNGEALPDWQSQRINTMITMLESLIREISPHKPEAEILAASRVLWASVHGITLLSVDNKLFMHSETDGKVLIENLINHYLSDWCR